MPAASSSSAAPSASASLSPGQSPPLFTVTPTDQSGVIVIVTAFCLALAIIATLVRAYVRFKITGQRLASDDAVIGSSVVCPQFKDRHVFQSLTCISSYSILSKPYWCSTKFMAALERQLVMLKMTNSAIYKGYLLRVNFASRFLTEFSSFCTPMASSTSSPYGSRRYLRHFCTYDCRASETIE